MPPAATADTADFPYEAPPHSADKKRTAADITAAVVEAA